MIRGVYTDWFVGGLAGQATRDTHERYRGHTGGAVLWASGCIFVNETYWLELAEKFDTGL